MKASIHPVANAQAGKMGEVVSGLKSQYKRFYQLGWQGMLGLAILVGAIVLGLTVLLPSILHLQQLEQDFAQLQAAVKQHATLADDRSPQAALNSFYEFLPPEKKANQQIAVILNAADAYSLQLDQVEYVLKRDSTLGLSRYLITMPLRGRYTDIRYFVIELMNRMPSAAVNELSFRREDIKAEQIEARLRLTVYLRRQP